MQIELKSFKMAMHPPIYGVNAIYEMPEGYFGWLLETSNGCLRFIPQEFNVKQDGTSYTKPGLDAVLHKHQHEREEATTLWINALEKVTMQHHIDQLMREVSLKHNLDDQMEQKVIDAICKIEGITAHITSKAKPLTVLGTHWDHIESVCDWGIMPMHKQGPGFRSIMKNAIPWKRGAVDKWGIFKPFLVAFCECPLFVGTKGDQPCCDMIATTPSGRTKMVAHYKFDSEKLLRNAERFEAIDNREDYHDIRELAEGVIYAQPRVKGTYTLAENSLRKLCSPHYLKGMEFGLEKNLYTEDGKLIDMVIDTRSVESKGAWSLALRDFPDPSGGTQTGDHLQSLWEKGTNIYCNNKVIGQAVVFTELFATTIENHLRIGDPHHSLKIRPEAHILGGIGYDPFEMAIKPNLRKLQEYGDLYNATNTILEPVEGVEF